MKKFHPDQKDRTKISMQLYNIKKAGLFHEFMSHMMEKIEIYIDGDIDHLQQPFMMPNNEGDASRLSMDQTNSSISRSSAGDSLNIASLFIVISNSHYTFCFISNSTISLTSRFVFASNFSFTFKSVSTSKSIFTSNFNAN